MITFTVYGVAYPKGSKQAIVTRDGRYAGMRESSGGVAGWSQLVRGEASRAMAVAPMQVGPIRVFVTFALPRPKKFSKRGQPVAHLTAPDIDKLLRAVLDALTHVAWHDDSQVVEVLGLKRYAEVDEAPHATITVEPTAGTRPYVPPPVPLPLFAEHGEEPAR